MIITNRLKRFLKADGSKESTKAWGDWWEQLAKAEDLSGDREWSEIYRLGGHREIWDYSYPSPELVGYVLGARLGAHARVLDVGCGAGQDAVFLASQKS